MKRLLPIVALTAAAIPAMQAAEKPNIIFILADDLGLGDIDSFSERCKIKTPNVDAMVGEGVQFMDAHTSSSVSTPTRYGVLTGRYNWRSDIKHGVLQGYSPALIKSDRETMASMLRRAGYTTAAIGKWHLGWGWSGMVGDNFKNVDFTKAISDGPTSRGFDYFYGFCGSLDMPPYVWVENDMPTEVPDHITESKDRFGLWRKGATAPSFDHTAALGQIAERGADYIVNQAKDDNPFFLYLPFPSPHTPILPSDEFLGKSGLNVYGDYVMRVDHCVGIIRDAIARSGEAENTILVFTADNGCSPRAAIAELEKMGHYPCDIYRGNKADLYDGGHRVPLVVTYPAAFPKHRIEQTVCLTDFYATFAAVTGVKLMDSEAEDSYNLLPVLSKKKEGKTLREATVHHSSVGDFSIRQGDWKLLMFQKLDGPVRKNDPESKELLKIELYDMANDPSETTDLSKEKPEVVERLRKLMISYIESGRSTPGAAQKNDGVPVGLYFGATN